MNNKRNYTTPPDKQKKPKKKSRKNRRKRYKPLRLYTRTPAARVKVNKSFMKQTRSGSSVRISGYDLIYNTTDNIVEGPFCTVTCNPAYWNGTRIATVANSYAQYRPLHICFDYYPQVSTMTSGNIVVGTIWNNNTTGDNLQQSLATSNGGKIFPVYAITKCPISLKTNLNQNLYNFQGYLDSDSNPFLFVATTQQTNNIVPGYFMVSYTFEFKNPLGEGFEYETQTASAEDVDTTDVWETTTAVLLSTTNIAAIGTKLLVKVIDDAVQFFLGGSRVGVLANTILKLFKSRPRQQSKLQEELHDLEESNTLVYYGQQFEFEENGSAVTRPMEITEPLTIDNFKSFKMHISGADYSKVSGLFVKIKKIGLGRYNLSFYNVVETTETVPDDMYIIQTRDPMPDYSCQNTNSPTTTLYAHDAYFHISYGNGHPIEMILKARNSFEDSEPYILADVALESVTKVLGVQNKQVVGTGDVVLVPIDNKTRMLN
jgi:hypothetical protein